MNVNLNFSSYILIISGFISITNLCYGKDSDFIPKFNKTIESESPSRLSEFDSIVTQLSENQGGTIQNLSSEKKIKIKEPRCAYVNFSGFDEMPSLKSSEIKGYIEFFNGQDIYFKKKILIGAQGNSSMELPKKNIKIDFVEDDWKGEETPDITIGKWVKQDGFHLKAYYTDYFKGLATISYKLYEQSIEHRGDFKYPWQRALLEDVNESALCHPDGFPCIVFLNGDFYGIFSWQLKKHRKNMNQEKNIAEHIHLDGLLNIATLFGNIIDWTAFEIRNPKNLYCMDGSKYDGDNPNEIMDETSAFFDSSNDNHILSAKVKQYIVKLSQYRSYLNQINDGSNESLVKELIEKYYDITSFIDYYVFSTVINNMDGFAKNWQWFTYDGEKWFVAPYDLDLTFGNISTYGFLIEPEYNYYQDDPYTKFLQYEGPYSYIMQYYTDDIEANYRHLRDAGIFETNNMMSLIENWVERIDEDYFSKEKERWPDAPYNKELVIHDDWEKVPIYYNYNSIPWFSSETEYKEGDFVRYSLFVFKAKTTTSKTPLVQFGYHEGLDRVEDWIKRRLALEDQLILGANPTTDVNETFTSPSESYLYKSENKRIFDILGRELKRPQKGINIINGKKIFLP